MGLPISKECEALIQYLRDAGVRFSYPSIGQINEGGHVANSYHYRWGTGGKGLAIDVIGDLQAIKDAYKKVTPVIAELFWPGDVHKQDIVQGKLTGIADSAPNAWSHVHVAVNIGHFVKWPGSTPSPQPQGDNNMMAYDPLTGGNWTTDSTGAVFAEAGAPYLGGLNNHPEWHAGAPVGIAAWKGGGTKETGNGYVIATRPAGSPKPNYYHFPGDGRYAK